MEAKRVAYYGIFACVALMMSYVEALLPLPLFLPGMKLGFANIVVVLVLYWMGEKEAWAISLVRVMLAGLLFQGFAGLLYSLAGAVLGLAAMMIGKRLPCFGMVGVSVLGAVFHNVGQILVAAAVVETSELFFYLPTLLFFGTLTGMGVGFVAMQAFSYLQAHTRA